MITKEEKLLFKRFISDDNVYKNDIIYRFIMPSGDVFIVTYDGEGESEINPFTGEYEDYYGLIFHILKVEKDVSNNYCDDALVEISRLDFPVNIELLESNPRT